MKLVTSFFLLSALCVLQHVSVANSEPGKPVGGKPGGPSSGNVIEVACSHSKNKEACINDLKKDPNSNGADLVGLVNIAIRLAADIAADVDRHLRTLMMKDDGMPNRDGNVEELLDPAIEQGVTDCIEYLSDANQQLDDSVAALAEKKYKDMELWVRVAIGDAGDCASSLDDPQGQIIAKTHQFIQMCENALSVLQALNQKG